MDSEASKTPLTVGEWTVDPRAGQIAGPAGVRSLEPKVMDLLCLLASRPGHVFGKDEIGAALWPGVHVGEDSLSRAVFKLRRALDDDPRAPRYVETIPKRGYRLLAGQARTAPAPARSGRRALWLAVTAAAVALGLVGGVMLVTRQAAPEAPARSEADALTARADDFYFQISRADNEQAIELYEQALAADPNHAGAQAGLANALVQKVLRWSGPPGPADALPTNLGRALERGVTRTPEAVKRLTRARALAESAVRAAPDHPAPWKALGFVRSAQGDFDAAIAAHRRAAGLDPLAWDALMNLSDLYGLKGDRETSLAYLERAYAAMTRAYSRQAARVRPWYAGTGVLIGREHEAAGRAEEAELWYRRVLGYAPLHPGATAGLARVLAKGGDRDEAERLCRELAERTGPNAECEAAIG